MARDRTARSRIRHFLAARGPIEDASGHATTALMDAIAYDGSSVAFIQLVAAMARDHEIERDIRGKRTYRIALTEDARALNERDTARLPPTDGPLAPMEIDYERLARSLVDELCRSVMAAERDDYAQKLTIARSRLDDLLGDPTKQSASIEG